MGAILAVFLLIVTCIGDLCRAKDNTKLLNNISPPLANASIFIQMNQKHPISPVLYGIFFEEIGHAGEGGLYAEMVQDKSFDATAAASGFFTSSSPFFGADATQSLTVDLDTMLSMRHHHPLEPSTMNLSKTNVPFSKQQRASEISANMDASALIVPWQTLGSTTAALTREYPLAPDNLVAMEVTVSAPFSAASKTNLRKNVNRASSTTTTVVGGLLNYGFWGFALQKEASYAFSVYIRNPQEEAVDVTVALTSADLTMTFAELVLTAKSTNKHGSEWHQCKGTLTTSAAATDARLVITFAGPATLMFDSFSLFPLENVEKGRAVGHINPWPFQQDLLKALKALKPAFLRIPGGCYVEGDWMKNAFQWKHALNKVETRPGHYNLWGYWSTDGLGLFEYMTLAEELEAEAVWVVNTGVAHGDSVPTSHVLSLVQDALDAVEFATGSVNSTWGSVRAAMGRQTPFNLNYLAIGNEDCGKPFYVENYNVFFGALRAKHPHLRLISNCELGDDAAPADSWDWHVYTNPQSMFDLRKVFDGRSAAADQEKQQRQTSNFVFASEYAVTDGGGWGNMIGAVAEAAFMTGLERNGEAVQMASYAPLFTHWMNRIWPTNAIVFENNGNSWFGIPSYHVQRLFRESQGTHYVQTVVMQPPGSEGQHENIAASVTCQDGEECTAVALKIVNFAPVAQRVEVNVRDGVAAAPVGAKSEAVVLTSEFPDDENSFDDPLKVSPKQFVLDDLSDSFVLELAPWSVSVIQMHMAAAPSSSRVIKEGSDEIAAVA